MQNGNFDTEIDKAAFYFNMKKKKKKKAAWSKIGRRTKIVLSKTRAKSTIISKDIFFVWGYRCEKERKRWRGCCQDPGQSWHCDKTWLQLCA